LICFVVFIWLAILLLLFNMLLHSSCLTCCSTLLAWPVTLFLLCSTCYSVPFVWHATPLLLLDLLLCSFCLTCFAILARPTTLLLLLNLLHSSCSTCSIPFAQHASFFLFDLFTQVPLCYAHDFVVPLLLLDIFVQVPFCYACDLLLLVPSARPYYFAPLFQIGTSPSFLFLSVECGVWSVEELSKFEFFKLNLEGENFCVQFLFVEFF
jgi:hypothetical protein